MPIRKAPPMEKMAGFFMGKGAADTSPSALALSALACARAAGKVLPWSRVISACVVARSLVLLSLILGLRLGTARSVVRATAFGCRVASALAVSFEYPSNRANLAAAAVRALTGFA